MAAMCARRLAGMLLPQVVETGSLSAAPLAASLRMSRSISFVTPLSRPTPLTVAPVLRFPTARQMSSRITTYRPEDIYEHLAKTDEALLQLVARERPGVRDATDPMHVSQEEGSDIEELVDSGSMDRCLALLDRELEAVERELEPEKEKGHKRGDSSQTDKELADLEKATAELVNPKGEEKFEPSARLKRELEECVKALLPLAAHFSPTQAGTVIEALGLLNYRADSTRELVNQLIELVVKKRIVEFSREDLYRMLTGLTSLDLTIQETDLELVFDQFQNIIANTRQENQFSL